MMKREVIFCEAEGCHFVALDYLALHLHVQREHRPPEFIIDAEALAAILGAEAA